MICDGGRFNENDLRVADQVKSEMGLPIPAAQVAALLKRGAAQSGVFVINRSDSEVSESGHSSSIGVTAQGKGHRSPISDVQPLSMARQVHTGMTKYGRKKALRHETSGLANRLAGLLGFRPWQIHKQWKDSGGMPQGEATEDDLKKRREWLLTRIREEMEGRSGGAHNPNS
jgi:hypothetical protein